MHRQLHIISDDNFSDIHLDILQKIQNDIDFIHLREKSKSAKELLGIIDIMEANHVPLSKVIINDRVDLAVIKKCAGVQLACHSVPGTRVKETFSGMMIGQSIHSAEEAWRVQVTDIDFLLYGHIFNSRSKVGQKPRGTSELEYITSYSKVPVIGIGGITPERTDNLINAGAAGVAVMSGIWKASDPVKAARDYRKALDGR